MVKSLARDVNFKYLFLIVILNFNLKIGQKKLAPLVSSGGNLITKKYPFISLIFHRILIIRFKVIKQNLKFLDLNKTRFYLIKVKLLPMMSRPRLHNTPILDFHTASFLPKTKKKHKYSRIAIHL